MVAFKGVFISLENGSCLFDRSHSARPSRNCKMLRFGAKSWQSMRSLGLFFCLPQQLQEFLRSSGEDLVLFPYNAHACAYRRMKGPETERAASAGIDDAVQTQRIPKAVLHQVQNLSGPFPQKDAVLCQGDPAIASDEQLLAQFRFQADQLTG